jgi:Zn finger protein HypA/HybF involved in hydrogenase expression
MTIDIDMFKCKNCGSRNTYTTKHFIVCRKCSFRREIISDVQKEMLEGIEIQEEGEVEEINGNFKKGEEE